MGMAMGRLLNLSELSLSLRQLLGWKQEMQILFLGLGFAGKTTIINKFKLGKVVDTTPTIGAVQSGEFEYNNISFIAFDIGQGPLQPLLRHYFYGTQGFVFVIDSTDREGLPYAKDHLNMILNEEETRNATMLVFANKQDLPNAMSEVEIAEKLGLNSICHRRWHIQSGSATSGEGLYEGMDWLCTNINAKVCMFYVSLIIAHCL
ncbi:hypothetical protein EJB05_03664, partial [Eragrostis curvula]